MERENLVIIYLFSFFNVFDYNFAGIQENRSVY